MALYDGFFDAVKDDGTGEYDRAYSSGDFTGYFANVIGSGVCVHDNPDSFKAELEGGTLYLRPGYLFIQGYWLANKAGESETDYKGYAVTLPTNMTGSMAVVAHLNLGQRLIEIEVRTVSQAYPDALVLAIITATTAEDTRHNTDICGVIDTAGELSGKVEWALNYIDTEIDSKLQQVEQEISAQDAKLNAKIAEVQSVADSIVPPPVGSIKFSASQNVGEDWLLCDGRFVSEADYPELVAALGKLTPSNDKFSLISSGEIGPQITNGVLYGGRLWVYSYSTKKLYGVDVEGTTAVKEITLTSEDERFNDFLAPTTARPLCLSIVPHITGSGARLFLTQIIQDGTLSASNWNDYILVFAAEFSDENDVASLAKPFSELTITTGYSYTYNASAKDAAPFVTSFSEGGLETYYLIPGYCYYSSQGSYRLTPYMKWADSQTAELETTTDNTIAMNNQRVSFSRKTKGEAVFTSDTRISSIPSGLFAGSIFGSATTRNTSCPVNIAGSDGVIFSFDKNAITRAIMSKQEQKTIALSGLPAAARVFVDGGAYLWGKDIYMIFVGTGIIFSRTLEEGDFGYLDTTSVLGTITQFGHLDYSQDERTLYLLGQDTTNTVKAAKMELNTLYDYANDGAWLPVIASDGVPAYIKAVGDGGAITDPVDMKITIASSSGFATFCSATFNGESLIDGTYTRTVSASGKFTVGVRLKQPASGGTRSIYLNNTQVATVSASAAPGTESTASFNVSDFISSGITLRGE